MAQALPAMTPEEALQTVASVRGYRERLTGQAAGIVWLVWGMALTFHAFLVLFVESPGQGADVVTGTGTLAKGWALELLGLVLMVGWAGFVTNAVWRSHALEAERPHAPWIPFAAGLAVVLVVGAINTLSNQLATDAGQQFGPLGIGFAPLAFLAAAGAVAIALLQRRRVRMLPGLLGALLLLNLFVWGRFLSFAQDFDTQSWGSAVMALSALVVYGAVGAWTMRKA